MEPDHALSFGQAILYLGGALALISWGVGNLFSKMSAGYGGIIKALQEQNLYQQTQLDLDRRSIDTLSKQHSECEKQHQLQQQEIATLKSDREIAGRYMEDMRKEIEDLKEKSHVTAAMQDVSEKVDVVIDQTKPGNSKAK